MNKLLSAYITTREHTVTLCEPLAIEDYVPQPEEFVSPPKWHLGHTTWFFEEFILKENVPGYRLFHQQYGYLFNSYYNFAGQRIARHRRGILTRPTVAEVMAYRKYVDEHMQDLLAKGPDEELEQLIILGINHEQQHQELLITDLKYTFSLNPLYPVYKKDYSLVDDRPKSVATFMSIPAGRYTIGADNKGFAYDNERQQHQVYLDSYQIASELVTNGEYLRFVEDDGYRQFAWWHDEAYAWLQQHSVRHPLYWCKIDDQWYQYTLGGLVALDPQATLAHISYYEAAAYAAWSGKRLPTEFEWEVASAAFSWGQRWEWTNSAYLPYPGFRIAPGAIGEYNGKFMVNQMVLRGASRATYPGHSRATYRNFFHPHLQWQLTGIRLAQ